jgi:hypothetical protein
MSHIKSFCWIRILPTTSPATDQVSQDLVQPCEAIRFLAGGRPPDVLASRPASKCAEAVNGHGAWTALKTHFGRVEAGTVFDFGPAFDSECDATDWIDNEPEGHVWDKEALNRFLIAFVQCDGQAKPIEFVDSDFDNTQETPYRYLFCRNDWSLRYSDAHLPKRPGLMLLDIDDEALRCAAIKHEKTVEECDALHCLQSDVLEDKTKEIIEQAQSLGHAIHPVLAKADINHDLFARPEGKALIAWVADSVEPVIFINKRRFMRIRPWRVCGAKVVPMFPRTEASEDRLYPGHPSYPSGHATMAYVWAYLLKRCGADRKDQLAGIAAQIGKNREIAGVHFASDTAAGEALAKTIVGQMLDRAKNPSYDDFIKGLGELGLKPQ